MNERQKRLIEVYDYLRQYYSIHTKSGFAEAVKYGRTTMSAALNGKEQYLTDSLFKNICEAYPGVFNLDYLLTGSGTLLAEQVIHDDGLIKITESVDPSSLINAALAAKDETIATLREQIETKDALIESLRKQIEMLKSHKNDYTSFLVADEIKPSAK